MNDRVNEEELPDVGMSWVVTPPIIIPLSARAKDKMRLPEGADAGIYLDADPVEALELFEDDYIIIVLEEDYIPNLIAVMSIKVLH